MNATKERPPTREPITIRPRTAAALLDIHYDTLWELIAKEVFTVLAPRGRGGGKPIFLFPDEIECYGLTRSEDAVRELRVKAGRLKPRRK